MTSHSTEPVAPRERLGDALSTPDRKRRHVARLFATIADRYDFITRLLSYGRDQRWKARLIAAAGIQSGERVLDLACGTGDLAFAAAARGARVTGLDLTPRMVQLARVRGQTQNPAPGLAPGPAPGLAQGPAHAPAYAPANTPGSVPAGAPADTPPSEGASASRANPAACVGLVVGFVVGDMTALPIADGSVDVITTGYGLRNVPVLDDAIRETWRVLAPGGRLLSLDFNRPRSAPLRAAYLAYLTVVGSTVGWLLHGDPDTYRYIPESIRRYPGAEAVVQRLRAAGFREARWEPVLGGLMAMHVARK